MKVSDQRPVMIRWKDTLVIRRDPAEAEKMRDTGGKMESESEGEWEILF